MSKPSFGVILIGLILAVCAVQPVWTQQPVTGTVTLGSGSALAGKVGIDQTTPGTTDSVTVATGQGAGATIGVTSGAKVITDANGTLQQYLRGIIYELITGITVAVSNANANGQGSMANSSPVVIASDQSKLPVKAASGDFAAGSLADGADTTLGAKADAKSTATDTTAITAMSVLKEMSYQLQNLAVDPCGSLAKTFVPINISTATTTQLVAASSSNFVYVCSINIGPTAGAQNIALIEDDTAACASPTAGMAGGTTAASGWNIAANGGLTFGSGAATVAKTAATNRYVCLISSAAQQTSGVMSYVLAP